MSVPRPIVFLTDYGLGDEFVGVCRGVIQRIAPGAGVIDLTHAIRRQDVLQGALVLARAGRFMPSDAVYLAIVDPGVGTSRRAVVVRAGSGAILVGPDNGLLSMAWEELGGVVAANEIASEAILLHPVSRTFHGRDVFAPCAAHLAAGLPLADVGPELPLATLQRLDLPGPMVSVGVVGGRVVGVDGFGNVQLNVTSVDLAKAGLGSAVEIASRTVPIVATFSDVSKGQPAAFIDSQGYLALAINQGRACDDFNLGPGQTVLLSTPEG